MPMYELMGFNDDIQNIIIEYLWCPIPVYQDKKMDLQSLISDTVAINENYDQTY